MRIAFVTYEFPPDTGKGGIGTYTMQVSAMLANAGWDIHVFAASPLRQETRTENGVQIHRVKSNHPEDFTSRVLEVFTTENSKKPIELIEAPEIHSNYKAIARAFPHIPIVVRLHAPNQLVEGLKKKYIPFGQKLRFVLGSLKRGRPEPGYWKSYNKENDTDYIDICITEHITAPSESMKNWVVKNWGISPDKITVIPNPFEAPFELIALPIPGTSSRTVLFYGRLNVLKGLYNGTIAMRRILQKKKDWKFRLVGDDQKGPDGLGSMKDWITKKLFNYKDRVVFENGIAYEDLAASLVQADILLLPSLFESFSYACAEAMAAGKAVIGAKGTGMENMIEDNINGILVNPKSVKEITSALTLLIENNKLRESIRYNARESIRNAFSETNLLPLYKSYYSTICSVE